MKFIKNNKMGVIVVSGILIIVVLIGICISSLTPSGSKGLMGNRLDGIEEHPISETDVNKVKEDITKTGKIESISYRLQGRIMRFQIAMKSGVSVKDTKSLTSYILEDIPVLDKEYYDIEVFFTGEGNNYPLMGSKHKTSQEFKFNNVGESSE